MSFVNRTYSCASAIFIRRCYIVLFIRQKASLHYYGKKFNFVAILMLFHQFLKPIFLYLFGLKRQ